MSSSTRQPDHAITAAIVDAIHVGIAVVDRSYTVLLWNHFMEAHSGIRADDIIGRNLFDQFAPPAASWLRRKIDSVFILGNFAFSHWIERPFVFPFRATRAITGDLDEMRQDCVFIPLPDERGVTSRVCLTIHDATDTCSYQLRLESINDTLRHETRALQEAQQQIVHLANHDPLTDLPNRRLFQSVMDRTLHDATRARRPFAVLTVDLDHFKRVNDSLGHAVGDQVIQHAGDVLRAAVRHTDVVSRRLDPAPADGPSVARVGGDEFVIVLPGIRTGDDAAVVARRITERMAAPLAFDGTEIYIGASIGIALFPDDGADAMTLMANADAAMYQAKTAGGNQFRYYTSAMNNHAGEQIRLESELRRAIQRDELVPYYQAIVDCARHRVVGAEVLLRWRHRDGMISPDAFIPIAEQTGMIVEIGDRVLRLACEQAARWIATHHSFRRIAVNVSPVQLRDPGFVDRVASTLADTGLAGDQLELEVTESMLLGASEGCQEVLAALVRLGVRIHLDDFGTGYSSLSYLIRFPIHAIKIDRCFVAEVAEGGPSANIVSAVTALAASLKLGLIAEGVETRAQLAYLERLGCHTVQGFMLCRPMPAEAFARWLSEVDVARTIAPRPGDTDAAGAA